MRYFPKSDDEVQLMLAATGKASLDELFSSIPHAARVRGALRLPKRLDELSMKRALSYAQAHPNMVSFLGAGATEHFVPEWVSQQLLRAEWYTSYTPYQPEASQGTLQAVFEFQSMVSSLFGLPVANASMYDGATALVEALLMAVRITGKKTVLISRALHPEYRQCIKTYFTAAKLRFIEIDFDETGRTNKDAIACALKNTPSDIAALALQSPNFFGRLEDVDDIAKNAHAHDALALQCVTDMTSLALLKSPGSAGIDIAVGEGLGLLGGLSLGGPGVGLLACRKDYVRQMPGRLVGLTTDNSSLPGYVLTLSTREQHIRREKATSNICTNHNLMALAFAMTLSAYGKSGFTALAKTNAKKTIYFRRLLSRSGDVSIWPGEHYN
jgi:glycine dehydrogenase subunit 1